MALPLPTSLTRRGKICLVIDKRQQLGGNVYCENIEGINVQKYGAHIFHTSNRKVWDFVNTIVPFNRYTNSPVANWKGELYNLPFNMNTFYENNRLYDKYKALAAQEQDVIFGGRLAEYKYYDMAPVVESVMERFNK